MIEQIFLIGVVLIFVYFIYQQYIFQKSIFFDPIAEGFTPQQVNAIIQPPGSYEIGTADPAYIKEKQILTVSNGYTEKNMNNLKPSSP